MGRSDVISYKYLSEPRRFAELFNYYLYDGEPVISPDDLNEKDPREIRIEDDAIRIVKAGQKNRDILKAFIAKEAQGKTYVLFGLENQSYIDYGMPVRAMLYDGLRYVEEIRQIENKNRQEKNVDHKTWLSGLTAEDRITPVITLILYLGQEEWVGPRSLHQLLAPQAKEFLDYIPDYPLNLIIPREIRNFEVFRTELRNVLRFIACAHDKNGIQKMMDDYREEVERMDRDSILLINEFTDAGIKTEKNKQEVNMCKGIEDMKNDAREEGREEGRREERANTERERANTERERARADQLQVEVAELRALLREYGITPSVCT